MKPPSQRWEVRDGMCGHNVVVDGEGEVWAEAGCETGPQELGHRGTLGPEQLRSLAARWSKLPQEPPPYPETCPFARHNFWRTVGSKEQVFSVCAAEGASFETNLLPAPYRELGALFRAAARWN